MGEGSVNPRLLAWIEPINVIQRAASRSDFDVSVASLHFRTKGLTNIFGLQRGVNQRNFKARR